MSSLSYDVIECWHYDVIIYCASPPKIKIPKNAIIMKTFLIFKKLAVQLLWNKNVNKQLTFSWFQLIIVILILSLFSPPHEMKVCTYLPNGLLQKTYKKS